LKKLKLSEPGDYTIFLRLGVSTCNDLFQILSSFIEKIDHFLKKCHPLAKDFPYPALFSLRRSLAPQPDFLKLLILIVSAL
jgi:hypothetical protein